MGSIKDIIIATSLVLVQMIYGQVKITDPFLVVNAGATDPLFTTYAAPIERSRFFTDKAYFLDYFNAEKPVNCSSQYSGEISVFWKVNNVLFRNKSEFAQRPVVLASFPDLAVLEYQIIGGLAVQEVFQVYSSGALLIDLFVRNNTQEAVEIFVYPLLYLPGDSLQALGYQSEQRGILFSHYEPLQRLHSDLYSNRGYPTQFINLLAASPVPTSYGTYQVTQIEDFHFIAKRKSKVHQPVHSLNQISSGPVNLIVLQSDFYLEPGKSKNIRFIRIADTNSAGLAAFSETAGQVITHPVQRSIDDDIQLYRNVPRIKFTDKTEKIVYLSGFNLVRQCMLPSSGKTRFNFYVFSRNPVWGWGHGHQVMHESLSMLTYAHMDWRSAQESQRIYMDQQFADGLIGYRHGPRGAQVYPYKGKATTSAPFFSWTNWEIYQTSHDLQFLKDAYTSGSRFIHYLSRERDKDRDGLLEWGPYGIIENVRDGWNAVFQLFSDGEDEGRDISPELDALDLNCQVANEIYHLKLMARELGDARAEEEWGTYYNRLCSLINAKMWDPQDKFYYHIAMEDDSFEFEGASLKRKEIIGFLPMWARAASEEQAAQLVEHLTNKDLFWREYGIPTLAGNDPHFTAFVDGCCRWNGPVWLLWDYMVFRGLLNYGYHDVAGQVARKMLNAVTTQLRKNHRFWESYSPDHAVQESPDNYIWDSIISRLIIDLYKSGQEK